MKLDERNRSYHFIVDTLLSVHSWHQHFPVDALTLPKGQQRCNIKQSNGSIFYHWRILKVWNGLSCLSSELIRVTVAHGTANSGVCEADPTARCCAGTARCGCGCGFQAEAYPGGAWNSSVGGCVQSSIYLNSGSLLVVLCLCTMWNGNSGWKCMEPPTCSHREGNLTGSNALLSLKDLCAGICFFHQDCSQWFTQHALAQQGHQL